ncbi:hypothetical protein JAAARDRAFT_34758 [Jaapia argillacea MUCL 33604]|uniref:Uncharacterized protein n=1 Tax=Jaapia argillacea MUCL 33604 TaxID=933084 RepID=A0A067PVR9_9AGAM|nr:hypothetical protein JAAARDRAFT_34758 [Jaapia argillacea MUCL 33604]
MRPPVGSSFYITISLLICADRCLHTALVTFRSALLPPWERNININPSRKSRLSPLSSPSRLKSASPHSAGS